MTTLETLDQIESLPVQVTYVGEVFRNDWGKYGAEVDQWRVKITSPSGFHCFDYFTGMGLRARTYSGFGKKYDTMRKKHYDDKPQKPKVADVMHSLILDASAADENFHDWCTNYGYSDDSIKAMNIYKQCLETAQALHKHRRTHGANTLKAETLPRLCAKCWRLSTPSPRPNLQTRRQMDDAHSTP